MDLTSDGDVEAILAAVARGERSPYEGAFEAFQIINGGRRWARWPAVRDEHGRLLADRPDAWAGDLRRPILAHMTEWWERRDDLRDRVDNQIRAFALAWVGGGELAVTTQWRKWRRWVDEDRSPFAGGGTNECPEVRLVLEGDVDLRAHRDPGVRRLELHYARLRSLAGLEAFRSLRSLTLYYVKGLADVRELERLPGLRNLRIVTDDPALAEALTDLDLAQFPELQRLRFGCHIDRTLALDTAWIPGAPALRALEIGAFTPAGRTYADIAGAERLIELEVTKLPGADAERLHTALPLTCIELPDPIEVRNPGGTSPFDLIWELDDGHPSFLMSPELADRWGVYNEYDAQDHLEALVEERDAALFGRVGFDAAADFSSISADSRYDLERVLKIALDARSVKLERRLWEAIENIQYDHSRRIGDYDMWERRDVRYISIELGVLEQEPRLLVATVSVNEGEAVHVVGHPHSDPEGAEICRTWLTAASDDSAAPGDAPVDEQLEAFRRLAVRVVRAFRRDHSDSPRILVNGTDPWGGGSGGAFQA